MYKLRLEYLYCAKQQERAYIGDIPLTDDEISLTISGLAPLFNGAMTNGQTRTDFLVREMNFSGTPELRLVEKDTPSIGDEDDLLGTWIVQQQRGDWIATFSLNDALYYLGYSVDWSSTPSQPSNGCGAPPNETLAYITPGQNVPEAQRHDEYRAIIESIGTFVADGYNLIGLRGLQQPGRQIVENAWNDWNDTLAVVWLEGGVKRVREYKGSCDPGKHASTAHKDGADANPNGLAHLCDGQWKYKCGYHHGAYPCLVQAEDFTVWRSKFREDGWADNVYDDDETTDTGIFGINMHASGANQARVWNWSAGCQVFCSAKGAGTEYAEVMGAGTTSSAQHGGYVGEHFKTHDVIYYTLVTARPKGAEDDNDPGQCPASATAAAEAVVPCPGG